MIKNCEKKKKSMNKYFFLSKHKLRIQILTIFDKDKIIKLKTSDHLLSDLYLLFLHVSYLYAK